MIIAAWGIPRFLQKPLAKLSANLRPSLVTKEEKSKAETACVPLRIPQERDSVTKKDRRKSTTTNQGNSYLHAWANDSKQYKAERVTGKAHWTGNQETWRPVLTLLYELDVLGLFRQAFLYLENNSSDNFYGPM